MFKANNNIILGGKPFEKGKVYDLTDEEQKEIGAGFTEVADETAKPEISESEKEQEAKEEPKAEPAKETAKPEKKAKRK